MAPPKLETKLKRAQHELIRARKWREKEYDDLWRRMVDLYRGKHYKTDSASDRMVVNVAFSTKNVIAPSVAVNNPRFHVQARKPEEAAHAVIAEEVLNYVWRTHKYQGEFRLAVDDFLCVGHGWLKVGYKHVKEPVVKEPKPERDEDATDDEPAVDDRDETKPGNVESEAKVVDDRPFAERVSVFDMYCDPDARNPREMRWIAQRIRRPIADVRVDKRYEASVRRKVEPNMGQRWGEDEEMDKPDRTDASNVSEVGYVDIIEFYDLRTREVSTFVPYLGDGFLIKPKRMPYGFGHPFVMLRNYEVPDIFYPMGELEAIEILQLELNATRTQMLEHRKRFARKWLYRRDDFHDDGIKALKSDDDNTMVPVDTDGSLEGSIVPMPSVMTPPEFYNQSDMIQADIDKVSGVSDYMRGNMPNIRRTATEAAMLQDAQNARAADKLARIEDVLAEVGGRLIQLMQQFMTEPQVIRIVGSQRMPVWVNYDADWISGDFDFEVEAGSTQPRNESFRRQSALQLMDAIGGFIGEVINPHMVARHVLEAFGIQDPDSFFIEQEPPPGMDQQGGVPPGMPPGQMQGPPGDDGSPIPGIPAELAAQLNVEPSPALQL